MNDGANEAPAEPAIAADGRYHWGIYDLLRGRIGIEADAAHGNTNIGKLFMSLHLVSDYVGIKTDAN